MDARIATVEALLHGSSVFLIPHFQRDYSWREKQWARLWSDALGIAADPTSRKHFIGPLVCAATTPVPGDNITRFQVIDGQQRLTTLSILFGAMRDVAAELGDKDLAAQLGEDFLLHHRRKDAMRYKLVPRTGDRAVWQNLVERDPNAKSDVSGIDDAWLWFRDQVRAITTSDGVAAIQRLRYAVGQRLAFVSITIADENPYRVFESLNTTGLALTEFDLVRNHLFMKVPIDAQEHYDAMVWRPFEQLWKGACENPESVGKHATAFLRQFLMRKVGRFNKGDTFQQFKTWCDGLRDTPEQVVAILSTQARHAIDMLRAEQLRDRRQSGGDKADWPEDVLHQRLLQLAYCDAGTTMPLLLELFDRSACKDPRDDDELMGCLQDLVSFLVRRSIAGEKTKQYDKKFVEVTRGLGTPVRKSLQDALHRMGWPSDNVVLAALRTFPLYHSERSKARLMLEEIERKQQNKEQVVLAPLQIEHVLPQTLSGADGKEWKEMLGPKWREDHGRVVHTLGNLTLTGFNQKLSNKSFTTKRTTLKTSKVTLNDAFHGLQRWNAERIETRGEKLGRVFLELFPVTGEPPPISDAEIQEKSKRADRNREFWQDVCEMIAAQDGALMAGNPAGRAYLDLPTNYHCLKIVPYFNRKDRVIGVSASFVGKEGDLRFATVRTERAAIEQRLGAPLVERERRSGRAASFQHERVAQDVDTPGGEQAAAAWLAEHAMRLRSAMTPAMHAAGAKPAKLRNTEKHLLRKRWFQKLLERARLSTSLHAHRTAGVESWVNASSGVRGLEYVYSVSKDSSRVELYLLHDRKDPERPKRRYAWFEQHRKQIAASLPDLVWERLDEKEACRLSIPIAGGIDSPENTWPKIHDQLVDAMIRLHAALQPLIDSGEVARA
jgi:hypothetical protein